MHRLLWSAYCNAAVKDLDRDRLLRCTLQRCTTGVLLLVLSRSFYLRQVCSAMSGEFILLWIMVLCTHQFVILNLFFFSFPVLPAAAKTTHPIWGLSFILLLFQYIYHCIKIRVQQHKIIICLFLLYLLVKLTPCRFSFVGSHRSNSHSCVSSPQDSCQEWKKGLEKHRGLFWSRPLSPCPTAALITQQETTAECRKWSCMHSLQEVECMPSRYS